MIGPIIWFAETFPAVEGVFRAEKSAVLQPVIGSGKNEVVYDNVVFDTFSPPSFVSDRFTVPSSINGSYVSFFAGNEITAAGVCLLTLQVSTDGGTVWADLAGQGIPSLASYLTLASGPLLMNTGDIYRVVFETSGESRDIENINRTFFSGYVSTL